MSDRLAAIILALLLAAPLCFLLDGELFDSGAGKAEQSSHLNLSAESLHQRGEGVHAYPTLAAN